MALLAARTKQDTETVSGHSCAPLACSLYMGCIEVLRSMRSLDFNTRTQVTREAINRLYEAVPGVKGIWKKKAPNKALFSILGKSNLRFAGMSIAVNISVDGLNLMIPTTRQIIANHHMQSISFASGGDTVRHAHLRETLKPSVRLSAACHILECCEGLAQSVISTVGQAFELRFKQYLHSPPKVVAPLDRALGAEESAWGEDEEAAEHDYYNSIPGKEPPPGGLIDSRGRTRVGDGGRGEGWQEGMGGASTGVGRRRGLHGDRVREAGLLGSGPLCFLPPGPQVRTKDVLFESISHLISHHRQNEQPIMAAESELHLRQVVRRKQ
ncbi:PREDICTED: SHC-transforming protein 2 [Charadrius vociferus]|uniref:SHC-transforming protein 2 n=1 Tax=Charadrius vociferus TaxID=50402 RepID=UPI000521B0AF|nr:PREDICTED: SHC-transforming protein 2 [Charadrius vociferus]